MRLLATLVSFLLFGAAYAQTPTPPTRALDGAGAPTFTRISSGNPPATAEGDFVIGPEYAAPPELTVKDGVSAGQGQQFTMDSKDSKFYPGHRARRVRHGGPEQSQDADRRDAPEGLPAHDHGLRSRAVQEGHDRRRSS